MSGDVSDSDGLTILVRDEAGVSGHWREVYFEVWSQPGTIEQVKLRFEKELAFMHSLQPRKLISFSVVEDGAVKPLDGELRNVINENVARVAPMTKAAAIVIAATGFKAALVRGIIGALMLFTRATYATRTCERPEDACAWIVAFLDTVPGEPAPTADDVKRVYAKLRGSA